LIRFKNKLSLKEEKIMLLKGHTNEQIRSLGKLQLDTVPFQSCDKFLTGICDLIFTKAKAVFKPVPVTEYAVKPGTQNVAKAYKDYISKANKAALKAANRISKNTTKSSKSLLKSNENDTERQEESVAWIIDNSVYNLMLIRLNNKISQSQRNVTLMSFKSEGLIKSGGSNQVMRITDSITIEGTRYKAKTLADAAVVLVKVNQECIDIIEMHNFILDGMFRNLEILHSNALITNEGFEQLVALRKILVQRSFLKDKLNNSEEIRERSVRIDNNARVDMILPLNSDKVKTFSAESYATFSVCYSDATSSVDEQAKMTKDYVVRQDRIITGNFLDAMFADDSHKRLEHDPSKNIITHRITSLSDTKSIPIIYLNQSIVETVKNAMFTLTIATLSFLAGYNMTVGLGEVAPAVLLAPEQSEIKAIITSAYEHMLKRGVPNDAVLRRAMLITEEDLVAWKLEAAVKLEALTKLSTTTSAKTDKVVDKK
jgi:hypothetical protein